MSPKYVAVNLSILSKITYSGKHIVLRCEMRDLFVCNKYIVVLLIAWRHLDMTENTDRKCTWIEYSHAFKILKTIDTPSVMARITNGLFLQGVGLLKMSSSRQPTINTLQKGLKQIAHIFRYFIYISTNYRTSHRRCSIKKGVLKNFTKFTGRLLCQSLFFNQVAGLRPATLLKKDAPAQVFFCEFREIFKKTFITEHLRWLPLD